LLAVNANIEVALFNILVNARFSVAVVNTDVLIVDPVVRGILVVLVVVEAALLSVFDVINYDAFRQNIVTVANLDEALVKGVRLIIFVQVGTGLLMAIAVTCCGASQQHQFAG